MEFDKLCTVEIRWLGMRKLECSFILGFVYHQIRISLENLCTPKSGRYKNTSKPPDGMLWRQIRPISICYNLPDLALRFARLIRRSTLLSIQS